MKDFYEILGVSRNASDEEIKKAYRRLAHQHHPDKHGGDEAKFKEINSAYQVLGNKEKRAQYDRFGGSFEQGGTGPFGNGAFRWEDVAQSAGDRFGGAYDVNLGDLFGDFFGFGSARQRGRTGEDLAVDATIDFRTAAFGGEKELTLTRILRCPRCGGTGGEPGAELKTCATCRGSGQSERLQRTILGQVKTVSTCPTCQGRGEVPKLRCSRCVGETVTREERTLSVKIPAGIEDGQTIRLAGEGEAGRNGASPGDLYIKIRIEPDRRFVRDGADILSQATITFSQAALGGTIEIPTLDGPVSLKVPSGTQSGKTLRLKGKGAARLSGHGRGDQLVTVEVKTPEKMNKRMRDLFHELKEEGE